MQPKEAVRRLRRLVLGMVSARVRDRIKFKSWKRSNAEFVAECLDFGDHPDLPDAHACIDADFHPDLPLIILNYTGVAHNLLHKFEHGWTLPLMFARGIRFTRRGALNALPFPKFHNHGQLREPFVPPPGPIEVTEKLDGHCLIISYYRDQLIVSTRGRFLSPTSKLAQPPLREFADEHNWDELFPRKHTAISEFIDPSIHVHVNYGDQQIFPLIGAMSHRHVEDFNYAQMQEFAERLGLPVVEQHAFASIEELVEHMRDQSIENREGCVTRFADGSRLKFKFDTYLRLMFESKFSRVWVMRRVMAGNLDDVLPKLSPEKAELARQYAADALTARDMLGHTKEQRWWHLYGIPPREEGKNANYRNVCREFVRWLIAQECA